MCAVLGQHGKQLDSIVLLGQHGKHVDSRAAWQTRRTNLMVMLFSILYILISQMELFGEADASSAVGINESRLIIGREMLTLQAYF